MSRVGKKPVAIPAGVTAKLDGQKIAVKGAKGELNFTVPDEVAVTLEGNVVHVEPRVEDKRARAMWGTARARDANLVVGVTQGFREEARDQRRRLQGGGRGQESAAVARLQPRHRLSHPGRRHDRDAEADGNRRSPASTSARSARSRPEIRALRGPEPYKGKGIKYAGEFIFRKEGKKK